MMNKIQKGITITKQKEEKETKKQKNTSLIWGDRVEKEEIDLIIYLVP